MDTMLAVIPWQKIIFLFWKNNSYPRRIEIKGRNNKQHIKPATANKFVIMRTSLQKEKVGGKGKSNSRNTSTNNIIHWNFIDVEGFIVRLLWEYWVFLAR